MLAGENVKDLEFWLSLVPRWCVSDTVLFGSSVRRVAKRAEEGTYFLITAGTGCSDTKPRCEFGPGIRVGFSYITQSAGRSSSGMTIDRGNWFDGGHCVLGKHFVCKSAIGVHQ